MTRYIILLYTGRSEYRVTVTMLLKMCKTFETLCIIGILSNKLQGTVPITFYTFQFYYALCRRRIKIIFCILKRLEYLNLNFFEKSDTVVFHVNLINNNKKRMT